MENCRGKGRLAKTFEQTFTCYRKLILCTLAISDHSTARSIYSDMPIAIQSASETQYLMYKTGLRSGDAELGWSSSSTIIVHLAKLAKQASVWKTCTRVHPMMPLYFMHVC